eukprot:c14370_g1_i1.p1 GENE.c14370_g1_i1~~c14370_g1_i1.p1  ORF type:complete len:320 (+),score=126.77 c14370_g1_i1:81-962(+)
MSFLVLTESEKQFADAISSLTPSHSRILLLSRNNFSHLSTETQKFVGGLLWLSTVTDDELKLLVKSFVPSAQVTFQFLLATNDSSSDILARLIFNGFINAQITQTKSGNEIQGSWKETALKLQNPQLIEISSQIPQWEVGSSAQIKRIKKSEPQQTATTTTGTTDKTKVWALNSEDIGNENFIDEKDLLDETDLKKPEIQSVQKQACPPTKKACKNCSCGRAELENQNPAGVVLGDVSADANSATQPIKSACGNCALGDAFRCASCPFLGLPPFQKGEEGKILLSKSALVDDI